jgi:hypothetical protein
MRKRHIQTYEDKFQEAVSDVDCQRFNLCIYQHWSKSFDHGTNWILFSPKGTEVGFVVRIAGPTSGTSKKYTFSYARAQSGGLGVLTKEDLRCAIFIALLSSVRGKRL